MTFQGRVHTWHLHNSKVKSHLKLTELDINASKACNFYYNIITNSNKHLKWWTESFYTNCKPLTKNIGIFSIVLKPNTQTILTWCPFLGHGCLNVVPATSDKLLTRPIYSQNFSPSTWHYFQLPPQPLEIVV